MDGVSMAKICARIKCCRCLLSAVGESQAKNKNAQPKAERSNASATCMFARTANGTSAAAHKKSGVLARDREDFARHVGREVAGEENHHVGDFPGLGVAAEGFLGGELLEEFRRGDLVQEGVHRQGR